MSATAKWALAALAIIAATAILIAIEGAKSGVAAPPAVSPHQRRAAGIVLEPQAQSLVGLETEALAPRTFRPEVAAYGELNEDPAQSFVVRAPVAGVVQTSGQAWPQVGQEIRNGTVVGAVLPRVAPVEAVGLESQLSTAEAEVTAAAASVKAARAAYERVKFLNEHNQNASLSAVQAARAKLEGEEARLKAAQQHVELVTASLKATKGPTAPVPMQVEHTGQVVEVLAQPGETVMAGQAVLRTNGYRMLLARVDVPPGESVRRLPSTARIVAAEYEDWPLKGEVIARAPVNPKLQGQSFILRVRAAGVPLRPGMSVTAYLESPGARLSGVVIPDSAVVWVGGAAWAYVKAAPNRFVRREVLTNRPAAKGWFTTVNFSPGDLVVIAGAQMLLSEEFKSQIQAGD